jgi:Phage integrase family
MPCADGCMGISGAHLGAHTTLGRLLRRQSRISVTRTGTAGLALTLSAIADICFKRLGVSTVHSLRHTFARGMEDTGAKVSEIQAHLGHESLETTGRYLARLTAGENRHLAGLARLYGMASPAESDKEAGESDARTARERADALEAEDDEKRHEDGEEQPHGLDG